VDRFRLMPEFSWAVDTATVGSAVDVSVLSVGGTDFSSIVSISILTSG